MAVIVMLPSNRSTLDAAPLTSLGRRAAAAVAAPLLAAALCWGMVDAVAWTQSSLMQVYTVASSTAA